MCTPFVSVYAISTGFCSSIAFKLFLIYNWGVMKIVAPPPQDIWFELMPIVCHDTISARLGIYYNIFHGPVIQ